MRIKRIIALLIALMIGVGCFAACSQGDETTEETQETTASSEAPDNGDQNNGNTDNNGDTENNGNTDNGGGETPPAEEPKEDTYYVSEKYIDATFLSLNMRIDYNELYNMNARVEAIGKFLSEQNASVICLQEHWQGLNTQLSTPLSERYEVLHKSLQSGRGEELVIAYDKAEWKLVSENRFWLSETPEVKSKSWDAENYAICYNVVLEHIETGVRLHVFNAKLDEVSETARDNGIKLIMSEIEKSPYPVLFGCDLNAVNTSEAYKVVTKKLTDAQKTEGADTGVTYHKDKTTTDGLSSDFCFVSDRITADSFKICRDKYGENNDLFLSDHYAIKAKVKISYKVTGRPTTTEHGFDSAIDTVGQA